MKSKGTLKHAYENISYLFCSCDCERKDVCRRHISHYEFTEPVEVLNRTDINNCRYFDYDVEYEIIEEKKKEEEVKND